MSERPLHERSTNEQVRVIKGLIREMMGTVKIEDPSIERYSIIHKRWRIVYSTLMLAIEEVYQEIRAARED